MVRSQNSNESPDSLTFRCLPCERNPPLPNAKHFFNTLSGLAIHICQHVQEQEKRNTKPDDNTEQR